jgi:uncharacterized protein YgiM (DUF1202 family)
MKMNCWLIFSVLLSANVLAQQATNPPASAPITTPAASPALTNVTPATGTTNGAAAKSTKKKSTKKQTAKADATAKKMAEAELRTVPLVAGPAILVASNVNVRGRASLKAEVLGRVTKGEQVTVLQEIDLKRSGPSEPSAWAKIALPATIHAWVNSTFLEGEGTNRTVRPKKLNVRGGPGENFSVVGSLKHGDEVKELSAKGEWLEIQPPADAFAFIAAQYLKQEAPTVAANTPVTPVEPAPTTVPVPETTPVVPPKETPTVPPATEASAPTNAPVVADATNAPVPVVPTPVVEEPLPPRIVQREGFVRGTFSIQAPTPFELVSPENGRTINYLYSNARDLDLRRYKGLRIVVTGEEGLDERWRNTPVITIQRIQLIEE